MRIQNHGQEYPQERILFERVLHDIEKREPLPDCGLVRTINSGLMYNGAPIEALSAIHPRFPDRQFHFAIIKSGTEKEGHLTALFCSTLAGEMKWHQPFEVRGPHVANLSMEVMQFFLEKTGRILTDRQGIEVLYPAYGVEVPPVKVYDDPKDKPAATYRTPLPHVKEVI